MVLSKEKLKEIVKRIVVVQGNAFIKELLRGSDSKIGTTKDDFAKNLEEAIDKDVITQESLEEWLAEVEGWGNQHLYLFEPPNIDLEALGKGISASPYADLVDQGVSLDFPDGLELKNIIFSNTGLSITWHQGKEGWNRWKPNDYTEEKGTDLFRYDAYRQRFDRSVIRFEWHFKEPYCTILIHRNPEIVHKDVFNNIYATLASIGCPNVPLTMVPLSQAVKFAARDDRGVHSTRFELDSGYVEMASTLAEGGIESVKPVRRVLHALDASQFERAQGMLHFVAEEHDISRRIAVQVYGSEGRLRIWAQCKRDDVFKIVTLLWGYNNEK